MGLVMLGVALAAVLTVADGYVSGGLTLAAVCALAAVARLLLPTDWVGTLAVRGSGLDALVLALMAVTLAVLTLSVPTP